MGLGVLVFFPSSLALVKKKKKKGQELLGVWFNWQIFYPTLMMMPPTSPSSK
jgi:hypothetical protein